jgi:hypothetical protein
VRRLIVPGSLLAAALTLASCSGGGKYRAVVAVDEAFAAAYPSLAAEIEKPTAFAGALEAALGMAAKPVTISLSQGAGLALDAVRQAEAGSSRPIALVASPLIASALIGGGVWKGDPPLLVPEWRGTPASGMRTASTDPHPAYRAAGAALGAYLAALTGEGGTPCCGILFAEGPSRPRSALQAFAEAYSAASGGARLLVRELASSSVDAAPRQVQEGLPAAPAAAQDPSPAAAKPLGAEEAVQEMLGSDIRALLLAVGPDTVAAARAASRPGLALGADYPDPDGLRELSFRIAPDPAALVEALARELRTLGGADAGATSGGAVPARLEVGGSASAFKAGGRTLESFLRGAGSEGAR